MTHTLPKAALIALAAAVTLSACATQPIYRPAGVDGARTGYAEQRERADDLATKIVDVVSKPFSLPDIRTAVARALAA